MATIFSKGSANYVQVLDDLCGKPFSPTLRRSAQHTNTTSQNEMHTFIAPHLHGARSNQEIKAPFKEATKGLKTHTSNCVEPRRRHFGFIFGTRFNVRQLLSWGPKFYGTVTEEKQEYGEFVEAYFKKMPSEYLSPNTHSTMLLKIAYCSFCTHNTADHELDRGSGGCACWSSWPPDLFYGFGIQHCKMRCDQTCHSEG